MLAVVVITRRTHSWECSPWVEGPKPRVIFFGVRTPAKVESWCFGDFLAIFAGLLQFEPGMNFQFFKNIQGFLLYVKI